MAKWWRNLRSVVQSPLQFNTTQSSLYHTIQAFPRELTGSRVSAKERIQGKIPAVVFSQNLLNKHSDAQNESSRKRLLTTDNKHIVSILKSVRLPFFCSTTFKLNIRAGSGSSVVIESGNVLPIKVHRDEESGKILNLVFVWAEDGMELKVDVPLVFKGRKDCPGVKKGGKLNKIRRTLMYLCPAEHIPQKIEVDVSNLDVGDRVYMRDLEVHPSMKLLSKNENMPVCKIVATDMESSDPSTIAQQQDVTSTISTDRDSPVQGAEVQKE